MSNDCTGRMPENKGAVHTYYIFLFVLFFVSYAYFFQGGGWNQNGRIYLTQAIINHSNFSIDTYKEDSPEMDFVNMGDWAFFSNHYYSNKSPGLSFLAVPPYALAQFLLNTFTRTAPDQTVLLCAYFSNLCTTVLMSSLLCLVLFYVCQTLFQMGINQAVTITLFFGLGTLAFPYSTAFYSHMPSAFCLFFSFVLAICIRHQGSKRNFAKSLIAGFAAGLGVLIEPSGLYLLVAVFIYMLCNQETRWYAVLFIAGCIPAGLAQGWYNVACFGHPLAASYDYANDVVMVRINGSLFGIPTFQTLREMLISRYRGLLFTSPVLFMMFPGAAFFFMQKKWRREAAVCASTAILFYIFIASFHAWPGGSTLGPRYLLPAYPWFFLLAVWAFNKMPGLFKIIGCISILVNLSITAVGVEIPAEIKNPLFDVVLKNIMAGKVSINPVPFSHFNNYPDIYTLAKIENWHSIQNFNSFNLGELLFPHHLTSVLPLLGFWLIWGLWWNNAVWRGNIKATL